MKPSQLLETALNELKRVEKDPRYTVDMLDWHTPDNGTCRVCLAGAMLSRDYGPDDRIDLNELEPNLRCTMFAIDQLRRGWIEDGLNQLLIQMPEGMEAHMIVRPYGPNPEGFKEDIEAMINYLRNFDL